MTFTPYQIDYAVKNTAKTLGFSKKKVYFKFGIANSDSIRQGSTGADCRGSEHEVVFAWSLKTGKRSLMLDNKEVHFSESGQNGWTGDRDWQHVFKVRDSKGGSLQCHFISQPVNKEVPGSKPFDLRVVGVSYFSFNKLYQLGTQDMVSREQPRGHSGGHRSGRGSPMSPEERRLVAAAKAESLQDMAQQRTSTRANVSASTSTSASTGGVGSRMNRDEGSLISFDDDPPPVPPMPAAGSHGQLQYASSLTLDIAIDPNKTPTPGYSGWNPPPPVHQAPAYGQAPSYGQAPPLQQQQQPPAGTMALTTYQTPPGGQAVPYVNTTGRMAMEQAPAYGYPPQQQQQPLTSPSGQSYASYGSAPSFAQPPRPPQPPTMQQQQPPMMQQQYPMMQQQQYSAGYAAQPSPQYASPPPLPHQGSYGSQPSYSSAANPHGPAAGYPQQAYNPHPATY